MSAATLQRLGLAVLLAALVAAFFALDLGRFLTLDAARAAHARFAVHYAAHPALTVAAYMGVYVLVTALSLPGAAALTMGGAALLGFWPALLAASFASSLGATLACGAARYLFRAPVRRRLGHRLARLDQGMAEEGAFYLFTLRLVPVFPFFVVNLLMGLTPLPLRTFYWVSQLGMLPGTIVYVNAGRELGGVGSVSGLFSPGLLAAFALLGLFPLAARRLVAWLRNRRSRRT
ncbi:MAG: TVP38/TMEM64 family protein [Desulfovibrionaceae bacterium]|jgi:uncharacterized membrane protein YdjX (TVP38/TMEM64 family)|nr:TVP38/TMEM64 family protein [Desulfovibrionaceae bacterium]